MNLLKLSKNFSNIKIHQQNRNLASLRDIFGKKKKKKDEFQSTEDFDKEIMIDEDKEISSEFSSLKSRR